MNTPIDQAPFFSIIIPCRIISTYLLEETLPALEKQTEKGFEVIVLPDTRTVSHDRLLRDYPWLLFDHSVEGEKPGVKRDRGVVLARGEVMIFLDDDAWPQADWLKLAKKRFEKNPEIRVLGGPGMMPPNATVWEQMINAVLISSLGSGGYAYRFIPLQAGYVDDFPSMNMMVKKELFEQVGGFRTTYWPGEDSKFLQTLYQQTGVCLYYDPAVRVYHHRRSSLVGHIAQYDQYGFHRGTFLAQGDENSSNFTYVIPSLFCVYLFFLIGIITLQYLFVFFAVQLFAAFLIPFVVYVLLLCYEVFVCLRKAGNLIVAASLFFLIPLTHVVYGSAFIRGVVKEIIRKVR